MKVSRRTACRLLAAAPAAHSLAQSAAPREEWFPTPAHQLVFRNWDLVPAARIAAVLGCDASKVKALARSMFLPAQKLEPERWSRMRFSALRRNWDFVGMAQLTRLLEIGESEITALLAEDAFYIGHLGPKPDCPPITAPSDIAPLPWFKLAEGSGPAEPRFAFIDALSAPPRKVTLTPKANFSPRIAYPYFAPFGDILREPDFHSYYPAGLLARMADRGLTAIWLHAVLRDLVRTSVFPELGADSAARQEKLNWLIDQARKQGLDVYLYLNEPRGMNDAFFARHPEVKGAPGRAGDGLHCMCTSTESVRRYIHEATGELLRQAPGLEGVLLITASENPTNCYSLARKTACPRCAARKGPEVIGEVVSLIAEGIHARKPTANVVAWDWSWGVIEDDPQAEIIAHLPQSVTLMADFERGTPIERGGRKTLADEYSLSIPGPSPRAAAHIHQARSRGLKTMAKAQVGCTWELSLLPNIPVLELVAKKFLAMRQAGVNGAMESWTLGAYPSLNWDVARMYYGDARPTPTDAVLAATTARYGAEAARRALPAWEIFSRAFSEYPYSNGLVYSSVVQYGPAHLVWLKPTGRRARILHSYDTLNWTSPYGPELAAQLFRKLGERWREGVDVLRSALAGVPAAAGDIRIAEAAGLYFESIANQITIHAGRAKAPAAELKRLLADEVRIATRFLTLCEADSRIGFEASLQYFYLPLDIREKIAACRYQGERI